MKKILCLLTVAATLVLTGCGGSKGSEDEKLQLWIAPNQVQEEFWKEVVTEWNESGVGMEVEVKTIPAAGSSEEAIMSAVASNTAPDISTNIFSGFGAQLVELGVAKNLNELDGFDELIATRKMETIIKGWEIDGTNPVFPIYSNPVLFWWRGDILEELGFEGVPKTYEDVYEISKAYSVSRKQYGMKVLAGKNWWDRWFDFIGYYYAASNGKPYINEGGAVYNDEFGKEVLEFVKTMLENEWSTANFATGTIFFDGTVLGETKGAWDLDYGRSQYPDVMESVKIGPMLVPAGMEVEKPYTLADAKGLVIFKSSKHPEEAWKFVKWVFEKDELSKLWLEKTGMAPARGDLLENPIFFDFYKENPEEAEYAKYVEVGIPAAMQTQTVDIQQIMTNEMIEPITFKTKTIEKALNDAVETTNKILNK